MMKVVRRKIVRQHFTVEAVEGMDVTAPRAVGRNAWPADDTMIVNEHGALTFPEFQRIRGHLGEAKIRICAERCPREER